MIIDRAIERVKAPALAAARRHIHMAVIVLPKAIGGGTVLRTQDKHWALHVAPQSTGVQKSGGDIAKQFGVTISLARCESYQRRQVNSIDLHCHVVALDVAIALRSR